MGRQLIEVDDFRSVTEAGFIQLALSRRVDEEVVVLERLVVRLREPPDFMGLEGGEEPTDL